MHVRNKLNVKQIPNLTKPGIYSDGGGLYLRVRPTGTRSWLYVCMINGKRREMGLGSVLDVSLSKARDAASIARAAFLDGRDPIAERAIAVEVAKPALTFGSFADAYIDDIEGGFRNDKHKKQWRSTLKTHCAAILEMPIGDVSTDDVKKVLKPIWLTLPETASRVRGRIERVLNAAKAEKLRTGENPARWRGHLDLLLPSRGKPSEKHHAALPYKEIAQFMADLSGRPANAARALEFTILTAARSGETLGMTWGEVEIDSGIWTVPADRMKAGKEHEVPLSEKAKSVLLAVRPPNVELSAPVFVTPSRASMSNMAMAMLLRRMERGSITVHGFRSTFRDWAGDETNFAREDIEMALAHTIGSKTERAYRRGQGLEKRREIMTAWSVYCSELHNAA